MLGHGRIRHKEFLEPNWVMHKFVTRRFQEIFEQQGSNLILLFLDWRVALGRKKHGRPWWLYNGQEPMST